MKSKKFITISILSALFISILALTVPASRVFAASPAQATSPTQQPPNTPAVAADPVRLEKLYQTEKKQLDQQAQNLTKAQDRLTTLEEKIAQQQAAGKNPEKLIALDTKLKEEFARAKSAHDSAAAVLTTHAGFDANGKVTNADQAKATLKEAAKSIRQCRMIMMKISIQVQTARFLAKA